MGARAPRNPHQNSPKYKGKLRPIFKFGVSFLLMRFYGSANASTSASGSASASASSLEVGDGLPMVEDEAALELAPA